VGGERSCIGSKIQRRWDASSGAGTDKHVERARLAYAGSAPLTGKLKLSITPINANMRRRQRSRTLRTPAAAKKLCRSLGRAGAAGHFGSLRRIATLRIATPETSLQLP
jgi:hypothetical protein